MTDPCLSFLLVVAMGKPRKKPQPRTKADRRAQREASGCKAAAAKRKPGQDGARQEAAALSKKAKRDQSQQRDQIGSKTGRMQVGGRLLSGWRRGAQRE